MSTDSCASIYDGGRRYYLRNQSTTNEEIALRLTSTRRVVTRGPIFVVPAGTFWEVKEDLSPVRLIAIRLDDSEVVLFADFLGSHGRAMLSIADFLAGS